MEKLSLQENQPKILEILGFNFRLGKLRQVIGIEQLKKADKLIDKRIKNVKYLENKLKNSNLVKIVPVPSEFKHVYYNHTLIFQENDYNVQASKFIEAIKVELPYTELRKKTDH